MTTITLWLLLIGGDSRGGVLLVDRFVTLNDCRAAAASIQRQASDLRGMPYLNGICVEAKVYKP